MFIFMLLISHLRGVCIDVSSSNKICFLLFGGFFTPNTKMMELMEQDAQLLKTCFVFCFSCMYLRRINTGWL